MPKAVPARSDQGRSRRLSGDAAGPLVDLHCHILPGLDDGPASWDEALAIAEMAVAEGVGTIVATPHQLGAYARNRGDMIRAQCGRLQELLARRKLPLRVLPGAEIFFEADLTSRIHRGELLTLADRRRHVLVELPSMEFFPLEPLLEELRAAGVTMVLAHPERNRPVMNDPSLLDPLLEAGCLFQITADSLTGAHGARSQSLAESLIRQGMAHFVASDAHDPAFRLPALRPAFQRVKKLAGREAALDLFSRNPGRVAAGAEVSPVVRAPVQVGWRRWLPWRKAG